MNRAILGRGRHRDAVRRRRRDGRVRRPDRRATTTPTARSPPRCAMHAAQAARQRASGSPTGCAPFGLGHRAVDRRRWPRRCSAREERLEYTRRRRRREPLPAPAAVRRPTARSSLSEATWADAHACRPRRRASSARSSSRAATTPVAAVSHRVDQPTSDGRVHEQHRHQRSRSTADRDRRRRRRSTRRSTARSSRTPRPCGRCAAPTSTSAAASSSP